MEEQFIGQTGGQVFYKMMEKHGVKHIFGLPTVPVLQALRETPNPSVDVIPPKHEQGAGHMAEGYARASGKPGVVFVNSGHGITNMITPIQDALSDGTPMVVFFERDWAMGMDDPDAIGIALACTKWAVMIKTIEELPRRINEAFEIATSGRPGPVLVDLHNCSRSIVKKAIPTRSSLPGISGAASRVAHQLTQNHLDATLQRVAQMINRAERPVIYAGQGVILSEGGPELLRDLAKRCSIPVTTTLQGLGAFDELDEKALHMLGMHGTAYANMAMQEADLIVALGARFDDRVTMNIAKFAPKAYAAEKKRRQGGIVHFEIVPKNINKVIQATEAVEGDAATNLARLLPQLEPRTMQSRAKWFGMINVWKKKWPLSDYERTPGRIMPQELIEQLSTIVGGREEKTYITTGVGQHQMWTAQYFRWRHPRTMITSGGLGTMGYGLPAAIGAKLAQPEALVIDIDGDASLSMTISELLTAARFNIGIKVILLNNEEQGMVTQLQNIYYEDRYAHTHHSNPDFIKLAESMHVQCQSVSDPRDLSKSLEWLVNTEGPALLEVKTEKKVPVLPTVPAGRGLHEFIAYDEARVRKRRELIRERTCGVHG
ncbi:Acetolactate synthase [Fusarium keratoplasticum]|uniref:Acetolactate synthase n=1 Tax=Fusarium keratoplasticum TaxID=1328300 RepID=A0ACC0QSN9_9HYPO|nr:Acetolactate synthase [Fusarium keratoplasticum]KAI8661084.1 Acetolactate synthase [Fusarium keratoplasticum]